MYLCLLFQITITKQDVDLNLNFIVENAQSSQRSLEDQLAAVSLDDSQPLDSDDDSATSEASSSDSSCDDSNSDRDSDDGGSEDDQPCSVESHGECESDLTNSKITVS